MLGLIVFRSPLSLSPLFFLIISIDSTLTQLRVCWTWSWFSFCPFPSHSQFLSVALFVLLLIFILFSFLFFFPTVIVRHFPKTSNALIKSHSEVKDNKPHFSQETTIQQHVVWRL